jgi:hypothetical protein
LNHHRKENTVKKKTVQRADAGESLYFQSELQSMMPDFYVAYPQMMSTVAIPTETDSNPGATTVGYKMYDIIGVAKIISNYADDLPRADVAGRQYFLPVHTLGVACGWDYFEVQAGRLANKPVRLREAQRCARHPPAPERQAGDPRRQQHRPRRV